MESCSSNAFAFLVAIEMFLLGPTFAKGKDATCGFPGTPAYGYVKPDNDVYAEAAVVSYSCRVGYILIGSPISRCTESGSWTEDVPICDDSMTTLGVAFSTPTVPGHPSELAIDKKKETCTYLKPKKPRWWRIDLGQEHKVLSVAFTMISPDKFVKFTVFVIKTEGTNASYKRCAAFSGKFGTQTVVLACAEGKGIEGQKVHIEDHHQTDGIFEICEVEVQVEKDTGYDCGRPDRNPYSTNFEAEGNRVEYGCITGYELQGLDYRTCLSSGQWSGDPPVCEPIICDELEPLENGMTTFSEDHEETPLEGSIAISTCNKGYKLIPAGASTRYCLKDGSWSERAPQCKEIRCPIPDGKHLGGFYRLPNITNNMGNIAKLVCRKGAKQDGDDPYIICTEEGEWTKPKTRCILPKAAYYESATAPRIAYHEVIIFGKVVAAIMIVVVLVGLYLYTQKRRNADKPELPSRLFEPPVPPPRPPPRSKVGSFRTALMGLMSRDHQDKGENVDSNNSKIHKLPYLGEEDDGIKSFPLTKRMWSLEDASQPDELQDKPAVVEVEVLTQEEAAEEADEVDNSEEDAASVEEKSPRKGATSPSKPTAPAEYAEVNYQEKRRSRLLKEQDSTESASPAASPVPGKEKEEHESSRSPTPPARLKRDAAEKSKPLNAPSKSPVLNRRRKETKPDKTEETGKEESKENTKPKEIEETGDKTEETGKEESKENTKLKEIEKAETDDRDAAENKEITDAVAPGSRRRRARAEEPAPAEAAQEEKPVLRRVRRY